MTSPTPTLADLAPALADAFRRHDYTVEGLERRLGPEAVAALGRSDAATVRRYACSAGPAGLLVRLFVLGDPLPTSAVADAIPGVEPRAGVDAGLWELVDDGAALRAVVDLRPVDTCLLYTSDAADE